MANILLIEDMKGVSDSLEVVLNIAGHSVETAQDGVQGLEKINANKYDLVITDVLMPKKDGTSVVLEAKAKDPSLKILVISGGGSGVTPDQALMVARQKADDALEKPFSKDELLGAVNKLIA